MNLCSYISNVEIHLNLKPNLIEELEGKKIYLKVQESESRLWLRNFSSHSYNTKTDPSLSLISSLFFFSFGSAAKGKKAREWAANIKFHQKLTNEHTSTYLLMKLFFSRIA